MNQSMAARWLELIESRTSSGTGTNEQYQSYMRWMDSWPSAIHRKIRAINLDKVSAFMVEAMAQTGS